MTFSISKNQIDKLGRRLAEANVPSEEDLRMLQRVRADCNVPRVVVASRIAKRLGVPVSSRLKTVQTIVEKLRRSRIRLSAMQDIAGVRFVCGYSLVEQDVMVDGVRALFPRARVVDRREKPTFGYRAVHVIVLVDGCQVEVQVRTNPQERWANVVERLADSWGRQIRYGEPPLQPGALVPELATTRQGVVERIWKLSEAIDVYEHELIRLSQDSEEREDQIQGLAHLGALIHVELERIGGVVNAAQTDDT